MDDLTIKKIVIVGGGTAGWISAVALSSQLNVSNKTAEIVLIESDEIGIIGVGEATVPHIRFFNKHVGLDERDLMRQTSATFKLGIEFCNWGKIGDRYIHPFGDFGDAIVGVKFHHHWLRARALGITDTIFDFSAAVKMAQADKFTFPASDLGSVLATFSYAYQFDASLYAAYLRKVCEARGVIRREGRIIDVISDSANGHVKAVVLRSGEHIEGDLFIDCSGLRGLLIEQFLKTGYEDWSQYLPANRAWAVPCTLNGPFSPYTRATAKASGWQWRIPLQHRVGNGYVFSDQFCTEADALDIVMQDLEGEALAEPKLVKFTTGVRKSFFKKNVVAIGLSAGFLEPLESTSIHLIQLAITHLIEIFPDKRFRPEDVDEYNLVMRREFESVRDFLILHYHATQRDDSDFWNHMRAMAIPASLQQKINLFTERGIVEGYQDGFFLEPSWIAVYLGQNIIPKAYDPLSHRIDDKTLRQSLAQLHDTINDALEQVPSQQHFIDQFINQKVGA